MVRFLDIWAFRRVLKMIDTAVACSFGRLSPELRSEAKERAKRRRVLGKAGGTFVNVLCTTAL